MKKRTKLSACFSSFILCGNLHTRRLILKLFDLSIFFLSVYFASAIRLESFLPLSFLAGKAWQVFALILFKHVIFNAIGLYKPLLRYSGLVLLNVTARAVAASTVSLIALSYFMGDWALARSVLIIDALLTLTLVTALRLSMRWVIRKSIVDQKRQANSNRQPERLLIYGAGAAGVQLLQMLSNSHQYKIIGFVDDNSELYRGYSIDGFKVYPPKLIKGLFVDGCFDTVVLAMPSIPKAIRRHICDQLQRLSIPIKTVPDLGCILSGNVTIQAIREIDVADLLGREEVQPNPLLMGKQIKARAVLVTGAGGSIGSELCRQILHQQPKCLVLYELNEFALYKIHQELTEAYPDIKLVPCLGNVTDSRYFRSVLKEHQIESLYHAAAYKHVPLLESNVAKAIENNVLGTLTVAQCAIELSVGQFVLISTDKAVRPTNIMGTTKRVAELIIQALSARKKLVTRFAIVRFGNVLGSSGSVVPRFRKQIAQGGPITLTHPDITRYFMSIPEAARLVIQAGAMSKGGEVFLLDMGEPVKIYDLATQMIRLSGLVPQEDIQIKITGLRPGEKLYEELLISGDTVQPTPHPKIYCSQEYFLSWEKLQPQVRQLIEKARSNNLGIVTLLLRLLVPEYQPQNSVPRHLRALQPVSTLVDSSVTSQWVVPNRGQAG